jgi:hypothetical protein
VSLFNCIVHLYVHSYAIRAEVEPLVKGIPNNNYKGFETRCQAEQSYLLAGTLGCLYILSRDPSTPRAPAKPISEAVMAAFCASSDDFLGSDWHVVTKGRCPGVYPAWCILSSDLALCVVLILSLGTLLQRRPSQFRDHDIGNIHLSEKPRRHLQRHNVMD